MLPPAVVRATRRSRLRGDAQVDDLPTVVGPHDEPKRNTERGGRNGEDVGRRELGDVIGEERPPRV